METCNVQNYFMYSLDSLSKSFLAAQERWNHYCFIIYLTIMKACPRPLLSESHLTPNLPTSPSFGSQRALFLLHTQLYLLLIWLRPTLQIMIILDEKRRDFDGKCVDDKLITVCYVKEIIRLRFNNGIYK